jgi:phosphoribosylanthranilate isomerase
MSLFVKICGITEPDSAMIAHQAGADAIGLVFAPSARRVSPQEARRIAAAVPEGMIRVAVFLKPDQAEVNRVLSVFTPDMVQADAGSPIELPPSVGFLPVVREGRECPGALGSEGRLVLFEGSVSGAGVTADWEEARSLARSSRLVLAGGLDRANVGEAIRAVRPHGVDVSSGVEAFPGVKDPDEIRRFVDAVRAAEGVRSP